MASKRTVLITGCSDGSLGSALAIAFHRHGWRVFASARNVAKLKEASSVGCETVQLDTLSDESVAACVTHISELTDGTLDLLINNAGGGYCMPVLDLDIGRTRDLFELNVLSLIRTTRAFFPLLMKSPHGGIVANNTSCSSLTIGALPFAGAYNATKAAAANLTENMRIEFEPFGVRAINLMTGSVLSNFYQNAPKAVLPPDSVYNIAKDTVEKWMTGDEEVAVSDDAAKWANEVAADLSKTNPPHWIWRGKFSTVVKYTSLLPVGIFDRIIKSKVGLDILAQKVKESRRPEKHRA